MTPGGTAAPPPAPLGRGRRTGVSRAVSTDLLVPDGAGAGTPSTSTGTFGPPLAQTPPAGPPASRTPAPTAAASTAGVVGAVAAAPPVAPTTTLPSTRPASPADRVAIGWVDEDAIAHSAPAVRTLDGAAAPYMPVGADLLSDRPRRSLWRAAVVVPIAVIALLLAAYVTTTLLWPLHAVPPTVEGVQVDPIAAPPAALTWPPVGGAAISVAGIDGSVASSAEPLEIASITKVVTALVVLDQMPLAVGEAGPEFRFTARDEANYWGYLSNNESALNVPVGGSLSQYQLLQGMLIGSANNYADRLAGNLWPNDAVFANAANSWLTAHGIPGITVVEPTGLDPRNAASPEALLALAKAAMADPVIAEIVGTPAVDLPGAGLVTNTNGLLADPGVIGIKTGSLDSYTLLSAKDLVVGETTVRVYGSVLGQPDDAARLAASRLLFSEVELALQPLPSVTAATVAGRATTKWGEDVAIITDDDVSVILWDGRAGTVTTDFSLGETREQGADVGTLAVQGPLDAASTTLSLATDIEPPSAWWRLTHPLDLFGLT